MSHDQKQLDRILSLHETIIAHHRESGDEGLLKKVEELMGRFQSMGLLEGMERHGIHGRYFLFEGPTWMEAAEKLEMEAVPNFVLWEESEFFRFLESVLRPTEPCENYKLMRMEGAAW